MSIRKTEDGKRINDPATKNDSVGVRGIALALALEKGKEEKKKTIGLGNVARTGVLSTELVRGMVIMTEEAKENAKVAKSDRQAEEKGERE